MRLAREVTTRLADPGGELQEPQSEILFKGRPTGKRVLGANLEAAIQWRDRFLLITTNEIPLEETLRIALFDQAFNLLDHAIIGGMYATGAFSSLKLVQPDRVQFAFLGDATWTVQLLRRAGFRLPFIFEPRAVFRSFGFSRQFIVSRGPSSPG